MSHVISELLPDLSQEQIKVLLTKSGGNADRAVELYFTDPVNSIVAPPRPQSHFVKQEKEQIESTSNPTEDSRFPLYVGDFIATCLSVVKGESVDPGSLLDIYRSVPVKKKQKTSYFSKADTNHIVRLKTLAGKDIAKFTMDIGSFVSSLMDLNMVGLVGLL